MSWAKSVNQRGTAESSTPLMVSAAPRHKQIAVMEPQPLGDLAQDTTEDQPRDQNRKIQRHGRAVGGRFQRDTAISQRSWDNNNDNRNAQTVGNCHRRDL